MLIGPDRVRFFSSRIEYESEISDSIEFRVGSSLDLDSKLKKSCLEPPIYVENAFVECL